MSLAQLIAVTSFYVSPSLVALLLAAVSTDSGLFIHFA